MTNLKFYEFNKHEYYALIGAYSENEAFGIYLDNVAGNSIRDLIDEGKVDEISECEAIIKFGKAICNDESFTFDYVMNEFLTENEGVILKDSSLM